MSSREIRVVPRKRDATVAPGMLAHLDDDRGTVVIDRLPQTGLADAPQSARRLPTPDEERDVYAYFDVEGDRIVRRETRS